MSEKFKNKYRIASHRKPNWDYSADALYFLTIVTQNRVCNLGNVVNNSGDTHDHVSNICVELSDFGKIVEQEWFKSFEIRDELILHQFVIMPNHLHAIVEIRDEKRGDLNDNDISVGDANAGNASHVDTHGRVYLPIINGRVFPIIKRNAPIRLPKSISSFMGGFKSAVNSKIDDFIDAHHLDIPKYNRNNHFFQPNYHDHIIRNNREYINISNYIINNPSNWDKDNLHGTI